MNPRRIIASAFVLTGLSMVGCYESVDVTWYEAGVYKGADDPLLDKLRQSDVHLQLEDRFHRVQTDR